MTAEYFAVPDPADHGRMTYWRRTAHTLRPWPPRARYEPRLLRTDVPDGLTGNELRDYAVRWWHEVAGPWHDGITVAIDADPAGCAARFAAFTTRCCWCGRRLTDPASKTYGVGPDCRAGWPPEMLAEASEAVSRAHAERLRS